MSTNTIKIHALEKAKVKLSRKRAQSIIPLQERCGNGIFKSDGLYIKSWSFSNVNFKLLGRDQEETVLRKWCEALNGFEPGMSYRYTVLKRKQDLAEYDTERLLTYRADGKDQYRHEYNEMLRDKIRDTNFIDEQRIFQAAVKKRKVEEARSYFSRSEAEFQKFFAGVGSELEALEDTDYLKILWQFLHMDSSTYYRNLEVSEMEKNGHSLKDYLVPYQFKTDNSQHYIQIGEKYFRALYVPPNSYAKYIKDSVLSELTSLEKSMCVSVDILPVETAEAYKMIETLEFRSETNIGKFMERQAKHGNFNAQVPYALRKKSEQIEEYNQDLNERDQRLLLAQITLLHCADSLEELNEDTDTLKTLARQQGCELTVLSLQQEDGMITALPFGTNRFSDKQGRRWRTLTTESLASFIPFTMQNFQHKDGIYYGVNKLTKSPIFINRKALMNGNAIILGSSGSGKSFKKKLELIWLLLNSDDKIIIIDPEGEYTALIKALGGEVIRIAADSKDYINAMEVSSAYNDGKNPVPLKSEFVLTLYAMAEGSDRINPQVKSILDRCVRNIYADFICNNYQGLQPTLKDLREEIMRQPEDIAKDIALTLELYTEGSLNLFSKQTNVDMSKRVISFEISDLGENLLPISMLIITDFIMKTLADNRKAGISTWVDVDELYLMFKKEYTAVFFYELWKRIRKYGGFPTGITQELGDLLKSPTARTLLNNSDLIIILSVNPADGALLQELFHLDDTQMRHILEVGEKNGMIKLQKSYIPITDDFPKDTQLYKIMSTKLNEAS